MHHEDPGYAEARQGVFETVEQWKRGRGCRFCGATEGKLVARHVQRDYAGPALHELISDVAPLDEIKAFTDQAFVSCSGCVAASNRRVGKLKKSRQGVL